MILSGLDFPKNGASWVYLLLQFQKIAKDFKQHEDHKTSSTTSLYNFITCSFNRALQHLGSGEGVSSSLLSLTCSVVFPGLSLFYLCESNIPAKECLPDSRSGTTRKWDSTSVSQLVLLSPPAATWQHSSGFSSADGLALPAVLWHTHSKHQGNRFQARKPTPM
jgi:hypothetical protein